MARHKRKADVIWLSSYTSCTNYGISNIVFRRLGPASFLLVILHILQKIILSKTFERISTNHQELQSNFYSGHHRNLKIVSIIERWPIHRGFSQTGFFFASETCSRVLGYSAIDPKMCQEAGVGRRKTIYRKYMDYI